MRLAGLAENNTAVSLIISMGARLTPSLRHCTARPVHGAQLDVVHCSADQHRCVVGQPASCASAAGTGKPDEPRADPHGLVHRGQSGSVLHP